MTFLPIATRELRVSARKRATFWLRIVAALVGVLIGALCLSFTHFSSLCRNWPTAFSGTLLSLLFLSVGGPFFDWLWGGYQHHGFMPYISLASPAYVFTNATDYEVASI